MSTYPELTPNSISYDFGTAQVSEYQAFGLGPIIFKHTNSVATQKFSLKYQGLSQSSIALIRAHYLENDGTAGEFFIPASVFGGIDILGIGAVYRYETTPTEQHTGAGLYSTTITVRAIDGVELKFVLDGGPAAPRAEQIVDQFVFIGTAPFTLNGSDVSTATLILNGS